MRCARSIVMSVLAVGLVAGSAGAASPAEASGRSGHTTITVGRATGTSAARGAAAGRGTKAKVTKKATKAKAAKKAKKTTKAKKATKTAARSASGRTTPRRATTPAATPTTTRLAAALDPATAMMRDPSAASLARVQAQAGRPTSAGSIVVAPWGSNRNTGRADNPLRTISAGLSAVRPGGTLFIRVGTYDERIINPQISRAAADRRITVTTFPGERPVLRGVLWLTNPDYWTISGLDIRWSDANDRSEHMVKMISGRGWRLEGNRISGARSYAGLLVCGTAKDWVVTGNFIRNTAASNGINQDHLMYVNTTGTNGVVERNLLTGSPNGQALKVGPPNAESGQVTGTLKVRYNTMSDNRGPANVQLSHVTSNVDIYRNMFISPASGRSAVAAWDLRGWNNTVHDNAYCDAVRPVDIGLSGLKDTGGNRLLDPTSAAGYGLAG